jgi:hypothetical protein
MFHWRSSVFLLMDCKNPNLSLFSYAYLRRWIKSWPLQVFLPIPHELTFAQSHVLNLSIQELLLFSYVGAFFSKFSCLHHLLPIIPNLNSSTFFSMSDMFLVYLLAFFSAFLPIRRNQHIFKNFFGWVFFS